MYAFSGSVILLLAAAAGQLSSADPSASTWEKIFDGGSGKWASAIAATGTDTWFVGGAWGIATNTKMGTRVESTQGRGVLSFFVESPTSVYALGEGELIRHFDGQRWTEEHVGPSPPRSQRGPWGDHMLYQAHMEPNGPLVVSGLVLVLVRHPDGRWEPPAPGEKERLLELVSQGAQVPLSPECHGRGWHWLGSRQAFFTCDDRRAFLFDTEALTPKGKFPRQCGSTVGALARRANEVYVTCDAVMWKTEGEVWRRVVPPMKGLREFSSIASADRCLFVAGQQSVWRRCAP